MGVFEQMTYDEDETVMLKVLTLVADERQRQNSLWGYPQKNTLPEWGLILSEEVGEVSQEMLRCHFEGKSCDDLITELVQVAAVAVSVIEHLQQTNLNQKP